MVKEARSAYRRRDEELAQRRVQFEADAAAAASSAKQDATSPKRAERSWWDGRLSLDGAGTSPVTEEINPMERDRPQMGEVGSVAESDDTLRNSYTTRSREITSEDVDTIEEEEGGLEIPSKSKKREST